MRFIEVKRSGLASRPHSTLVSCHIMTWKWREGEWMWRCVRSVCSLSHLREHPYCPNTRLTVLLGHIYIYRQLVSYVLSLSFRWHNHGLFTDFLTVTAHKIGKRLPKINWLDGFTQFPAISIHQFCWRWGLQGPGLLQWVLFEEENRAVIDIKSLKDTQY